MDTKLPVDGVAAVLTSLSWVLLGGARDELDHSTLNYELLQLGTPKEHAGAIARVYKERRAQLIMATRRDSLRLSSLVRVGWRVDQQVRVWRRRWALIRWSGWSWRLEIQKENGKRGRWKISTKKHANIATY